MDFSVVIPVYNSSDFLFPALDSIAASSANREYEVIVVDDCSDDIGKTRQIVDSFSGVSLVQKERKTNAADSRNIGMALSKADYVFFLDSDDRVLPGYIDRRIRMLQETGAGLLFGDFLSSAGTRKIRAGIPSYAGGDTRDYLFVSGGDCRSSTISVNRKKLAGCTFDGSLEKHQDWGFLLRAYDAGTVIHFDPEPGVLMQVYHADRMSRSSNVDASRFFMRKYLKERRHINGFSRKHWKSVLAGRDQDAIRFFFGIYRPEKIFLKDAFRFYLYRILSTVPLVYPASCFITFFRKIKWQ
ncbi:MAG: glycosyltransferase family 2 protein [Chlorobium phaeobacteroides]|uniref:Glycosyl transferase family 2 n=1 Tax=Chlorobium phaeobacteroides (strain BS1) TaxID=331678 RepID=B3ELL7_CHLPB|nr:glycosyltransferase family 2 protein [Chlorobium phaeobacteroides]MBL6957119.1 glycosyltransferase family 2 protein [Chlorobium phaeobacteroides]